MMQDILVFSTIEYLNTSARGAQFEQWSTDVSILKARHSNPLKPLLPNSNIPRSPLSAAAATFFITSRATVQD